jgi:hypothetical protein
MNREQTILLPAGRRSAPTVFLPEGMRALAAALDTPAAPAASRGRTAYPLLAAAVARVETRGRFSGLGASVVGAVARVGAALGKTRTVLN